MKSWFSPFEDAPIRNTVARERRKYDIGKREQTKLEITSEQKYDATICSAVEKFLQNLRRIVPLNF